MSLSGVVVDANTETLELGVLPQWSRKVPIFSEVAKREYLVLDTASINAELRLSGQMETGEGVNEWQPSFSAMEEGGKSRIVEIPQLKWPERQEPILTNLVRRLLRGLWVIVVSRALQTGFPLRRTIVSVFEDPTEKEQKAVLRLVCDANASQALAFWDSLEADLQNWVKTLTELERTNFITKLNLRVHWR